MIRNDGAHTGIATDADLSDADRQRASSLLTYLDKYAKGEPNAVPVTELANAVEVSGRKVRTLVTHLRRSGRPVLATPGSGYFMPRTRADAEHTKAFLKARIASTLAVLNGIERGLDDRFPTPTEQLEQLELAG